MSDPRSDAELLAAHAAGDPVAFGLLFARHRDRLWAVALRTTGDPEEAADGLQDGMIAAFRRAGSFRGEAAVTTWLHRVVVNACLDRLRASAVRRTTPLAEQPEAPDPTADVHRGAEAGERRRRVLAALATLPVDQRAALVLVDMEGYSVAEAAAVLAVPEGTVKSRCSRGRVRLAGLLRDLLADGDAPQDGNPGPPPPVPPPDRPARAPPG